MVPSDPIVPMLVLMKPSHAEPIESCGQAIQHTLFTEQSLLS